MDWLKITAQCFGIAGLIFSALSFQEKNNKKFFVKQGLSGFMFFLNFLMIGAIAAALFNLTNVIRGGLFAKKEKNLSKLIIVEVLYTACFIFSLTVTKIDALQLFLSVLTFLSLVVMSVFMWKGNGKHIRYVQFTFSSPSWIIHNIFNFTLGGILCEVFAMMSVIVSFIRFGKDGFEK